VQLAVAAFQRALVDCGHHLTLEVVNLSAYNVLENAADLNDTRAILGYTK